ncbi:MAG TPA: DNA photolyase [bacterium]|nr:DNA photolyase [bacterium]HPR86452.1 DNA photolyase [bacterium]
MSAATSQPFLPSHLFIEEAVRESPWTQRILARLPQAERIAVPDGKVLPADHPPQSILLARQRGPFLRLCPGTSRHICCLYHNLDIAAGCDLGCSYCILQGYLNVPMTTLYCNLETMFAELDATLAQHPRHFYRIGTGELADSLTFDHFTAWSSDLVGYFSRQSNAIIELKSKNTHTAHFLQVPHHRRTVVSWSVNAAAMITSEEPLAPPLAARLDAAAAAQEAGFWIGFHFDPMIRHEGWEEGYHAVVEAIFSRIKPENIAWISLGALRYPPFLDDIIRENHPASRIRLGELLPGADHKLRYFKPQRIEMFAKMYRWIKAHGEETPVYLCMESDEIWRKSFGWSPGNSAGLKKLLDRRVGG